MKLPSIAAYVEVETEANMIGPTAEKKNIRRSSKSAYLLHQNSNKVSKALRHYQRQLQIHNKKNYCHHHDRARTAKIL